MSGRKLIRKDSPIPKVKRQIIRISEGSIEREDDAPFAEGRKRIPSLGRDARIGQPLVAPINVLCYERTSPTNALASWILRSMIFTMSGLPGSCFVSRSILGLER